MRRIIQKAIQPPSTIRLCPVWYEPASSLASQHTALATSAGVPNRLHGVLSYEYCVARYTVETGINTYGFTCKGTRTVLQNRTS